MTAKKGQRLFKLSSLCVFVALCFALVGLCCVFFWFLSFLPNFHQRKSGTGFPLFLYYEDWRWHFWSEYDVVDSWNCRHIRLALCEAVCRAAEKYVMIENIEAASNRVLISMHGVVDHGENIEECLILFLLWYETYKLLLLLWYLYAASTRVSISMHEVAEERLPAEL